MDNHKLFDLLRASTLFEGRLEQGQVEGIEAKVAAFASALWPLSFAAYGLATSYHETARHMLPVREGLGVSDTWRQQHLRYYPYYGRGDVQLTWLKNYQRADRELQLQGALLKNLDLALDKDISARVMVKGMDQGWFDGKKLSDYLKNEEGLFEEFVECRRIINGTDKARMIADYALQFQDALKEAGYEPVRNPSTG